MARFGQDRARRTMEAMMKMVKIDIAEVERAAGAGPNRSVRTSR